MKVAMLFLLDGVERVQQIVEIVHAVVLQLNAALFPAGDDAAGTAQTFAELMAASSA